MESLVNFLFSDVFEACVQIGEVLYLPLSALTSFLTSFFLLTVLGVALGAFFGELIGSILLDTWSFVCSKLKSRKSTE